MNQPASGRDRRKNPRIDKGFCLKYYVKDAAKHTCDISQIKDISQGGVRFLTSFLLLPDTRLVVELHTPYVDKGLMMEGVVVACQEKVPNVIYEVRLKFADVDAKAKEILEIIEKKYHKGD